MHNTTVQKIQFRLTWHWFFRKCIKSECSFFFPGLWLAVGDVMKRQPCETFHVQGTAVESQQASPEEWSQEDERRPQLHGNHIRV